MDGPASQRVFAVPELLENICLSVVEAQRPRRIRIKLGPKPAASLYVLQQVDKTWCATINGSKKLLRLMLLRPASLDSTNTDSKGKQRVRDRLKSAMWLFSLLFPSEPPQCSTKHDHLTIFIDPFHGYKFPDRISDYNTFLERYGHKNAEWRDIKLDSAETPAPVHVLHGCGRDGIEWHFASDATLGDLFDRSKELLDRLIGRYRTIDIQSPCFYQANEFDKIVGAEGTRASAEQQRADDSETSDSGAGIVALTIGRRIRRLA